MAGSWEATKAGAEARAHEHGRRATIMDVADRAGVSIKTVSRVLNGEPNVRAATRDRVMQAASAMHYHPNVIAQGLVGRRSYLIGLFYENPSPNYVVELQRGTLDRLHGEKYRLVVLPVERAAAVAGDILGLVRSTALDGIVLTPPASDDPVILARLAEAGFPFVRIAPTRMTDTSALTTTDDVAAAREMTDYLIALGHRRIGTILGDPGHGSSEQRLAGFHAALAAAGLAAAGVEQGLYTFDSGLAAGRRLLDRPVRPTAIFAQNDDMAAGAIMAAHDLGLDVPGDVSVAGFDDSAIATIVWPRITTIHQPVFDMARAATDMLVALLEKRPHTSLVAHPFRLVQRQSTGLAPIG